jgi:methylenetetrahydrofolate reductase (NADPH)
LVRLEDAEGNPDDVIRIGQEHALAQVQGLVDGGISGLHFYTLNKSKATADVVRAWNASKV